MENSNSEAIKCVVIGDTGIGRKTLMRILGPAVKASNNQTAQSEKIVFDQKEFEHKFKGSKYQISFFAPSANEDYDRMRPLFYGGTDIFILAFAVDDEYSFEHIKNKWNIETQTFSNSSQSIPIIILGLKSDLRRNKQNSDRLVKVADAQELCKDLKAVRYLECSGSEGKGIDEMVNTVCYCIQNTRHPGATGGCCVIQ